MSDALGSNIPPLPSKRVGKTPPKGMPETVRIRLEENDGIPPTGQFFGLNGKGYLIRAGEEVNVPRGIIEILDNAVMETPVIDPTSRRVTGYRTRMRYPYHVVREQLDEE